MTNSVFIVARAIPNVANKGQWLPVYTVNGHLHGSTYAVTGYSKDEAIALALQMAEEEAARYVGDWDVTIVTQTIREDAND